MFAIVSLWVPTNQLYTVQRLVLRERKSLLLQSSVWRVEEKWWGDNGDDYQLF